MLLGGEPLTVSHEGDYLQLDDLVYVTFKLFQMSILWRAAVVKHAMFARVKLGQHEETLRAMLEAGEAGWPEQYPCVVIGLKSQRPNIAANFIDQPTRLRLHGHIAYRFIFAGFIWVYYVSSHRLPHYLSEVVLSRAGRMKIWIGDFEDLGYLRELAVDLKSMGRLPGPSE